MSLQRARDFIDRAYQDKKVAEEGARRYDDIVNVGRENGFEFNRDEFNQAVRERKRPDDKTDPATDPDTCFSCI